MLCWYVAATRRPRSTRTRVHNSNRAAPHMQRGSEELIKTVWHLRGSGYVVEQTWVGAVQHTAFLPTRKSLVSGCLLIQPARPLRAAVHSEACDVAQYRSACAHH